MAFGAGGGSPDEVKSEINVTPLVDVCLVLLIIFMVVTPMLQQGVDVLLPEGQHAVKKPGKETDLIISVKRDKRINFGKVRLVMKAANEAGFTQVGILTQNQQAGQQIAQGKS